MTTKLINNWCISYMTPRDPYQAPELVHQCLVGDVEGRTNGPVRTTAIQGKRGNNIITKNNEYVLGDVDPLYESMFPNARQRLLESALTID